MMTINRFPQEPPVPPQEPDAFACCGNGCGEACVWTIYRHARKRYEAELAAWEARMADQNTDGSISS